MGSTTQNTKAPGSATRRRMLTPLPPGLVFERVSDAQGGGSEVRAVGMARVWGKGAGKSTCRCLRLRCAEPATRAGPLASGGIQALEPVAVTEADAVHAFVVLLGIGVGHVLEVNRDVVVLVQMVADFHGDVEQHP